MSSDRSIKPQACFEYWISIRPKNRLNCFASVEGCYLPQTPDASGRYCVSSIPGLTFKPDRIWLDKEDCVYPPEEAWFEVAPDAPRLEKIPLLGEGVDWSRGLLKFPVDLETVALAFDDYIYWCPEAKFEFANGRPEIGGREGIKGLTGMLLMTFGLIEVVKLAHPRDWVAALLEVRARAMDATHKAHW